MYFGLKLYGLSLTAIALGAGLSGCGGGDTVGEALGYEQKGPDEMTVIKRPPLIVPPDFNLRPPRAGEPRSEADAASRAARDTLIGPSSELAPETPDGSGVTLVNTSPTSATESAAERTKRTLSGQQDGEQSYDKSPPLKPDEDQTVEVAVDEPPSAGQTALLSRTNKVERDIDALTETRAENRIDGALLRRLLAWKQTPVVAEEGAGDGETDAKPKQIVQIVRREQTAIGTETNLE